MWRRVLAALALLALCSSTGVPKDPGVVLDDVARTMGAADLNRIQYSGNGFAYAFGQNAIAYIPYPKFYAKYSRIVDYEKGLSREETVRTQFENPPRGGGGQPLYREARGVAVVNQNSPWDGGALALTPHGFVKAAKLANPNIKATKVNGKTMTLVSFTAQGKYEVNGYLNDRNLLEKVETWTPNPILGDMLIETSFSGYRDFSGTKFPTKIVQKQGGYLVLELTVSDVQPNAAVKIEEPGGGGEAGAQVRVESQKIADGVWYLAGTTDVNSQAVEFKDFTVIIESSVSEARALANIAEVKRLLPNKPIRYNVNSHHHSDHAGGLRTYVAEGVTIISHEEIKKFYEQTVLRAPHKLAPDKLSQNPKPAKFIWMKDKYVVTDGERALEIYHVPNGHAPYLLMSYLPKEKVLFITDIFNRFGVPRPNDPPPGIVTPYYAALGDRIKQLNLDVQTVAPCHGKQAVPVAELQQTLVGTVQAPPVP